MLIAHVGNTIVAGAPIAIANATNEYSAHKAVTISPQAPRWSPDIDIRYERQKACDAVRSADIIHCHGCFRLETPGDSAYLLKAINPKAKAIFHAHSWPKDSPGKHEKNRYAACLIMAQGWTRYYDASWIKVRNVIPIYAEEFIPIPWAQRIRRIAFTPSNPFNNDLRFGPLSRPDKPNPKGLWFTKRALRGLPLGIEDSKPYRSVLRWKRNAWLGIDEVVTPNFHRSGLEFLAAGVPCIETMDAVAIRDMQETTGTKENPFILLDDPMNLRAKVVELLGDEGELIRMSTECKRWMRTYWKPEDIVADYVKIYESIAS